MGGSTKRTPWKGEKRPYQCFQTAKGRSNSAFAISFGQTASSCKHSPAFRKLSAGKQLQAGPSIASQWVSLMERGVRTITRKKLRMFQWVGKRGAEDTGPHFVRNQLYLAKCIPEIGKKCESIPFAVHCKFSIRKSAFSYIHY